MDRATKPADIPTHPGVYIFRDSKHKPLYIGKAVNLRARTKAYFAKNLNNNRLAQMVTTAAKLDWQVTDSEIEALILESQLIKKFKPRFNIMLRDDKQYFYVEITDEEFPKIFITHRPAARLAEAFGVAQAEIVPAFGRRGQFTEGTGNKVIN